MADGTVLERIAVLEAKVQEIRNDHADILEQLKEINGSLTKYKGFVGGVAFVFTSVVTFISMGKEWILAHIK